MKIIKTLPIVLLLLLCEASFALKPSASYRYNPLKSGLVEELRLPTPDGAELNVWHLHGDESFHPIIISESDAGNMGDWLHLALSLQSYGLDVWLYDYRGFGSSSGFEIQQPYLFYTEFITDLSTVVSHAYASTGQTPVLYGLSMGTIIVEEYLKHHDVPVCAAIFDGYVCSPSVWKERLSEKGKNIAIPEDYIEDTSGKILSIPRMYIFARQDDLSRYEDLPDRKGRHVKTATFDCGHLEAFFTHREKYLRKVVHFIDKSAVSANN